MTKGVAEGRLSFTLTQAVESTGFTRTAIYQAISAGTLKSFKVGRRRMVSAEALQEFIANLERSATQRREPT